MQRQSTIGLWRRRVLLIGRRRAGTIGNTMALVVILVSLRSWPWPMVWNGDAVSCRAPPTRPSDILAMVGWAFSLAMAGNFPALVLGVWWKRATTTGAICGIIAGWGICLFYLVVSRYFPQAGVTYFGMTSLLNPETGQALINVGQLMADPKWIADVPASAANPMASRVGWFDLNNINCGLLGMPLGFLVIYVVSLMTKEPSKEMQAFIDEIRKPRGHTILEGTGLAAFAAWGAGPFRGPAPFHDDAGFELSHHAITLRTDREAYRTEADVNPAIAILPFWYFHLPNFHAGSADVHTARPRLARTDGRCGFAELHLAVFLPHHRSVRRG